MPRILAGLAACLAAAAASAQPAPRTPVFGADVEMVAVDVAVVDGEGRPVRGLGPDDFELEIGGKKRRVLSADYFEVGADPEQAPAATALRPYSTNEGSGAGRAVVLLFDTGSMTAGAGRGAARAAERLLDQLSPADRVALLTIPGRDGPQVDLTSDHASVRAAASRIVGRGLVLGGRRRLSVTEALAMEDGRPEWGEAVERECAGAGEFCLSELQDEAYRIDLGLDQQATESMSALRAVFRALARIEGRKTVVLVTEGLVTDTGGHMRDLGRDAGAAGVTLYVLRIDGRGLDPSQASAPRDTLQDDFILGAGLEQLASATNGASFRITGHGEKVFERLAREISGYYLLGFAPEERDRDGKVHDIKARVRRPGASVRTRRALSIPTASLDTKRQRDLLAAALQSPVPAVEIPLRVSTWTVPGRDGKVRVLMAADVGAEGTSPAGLAVGWVLLSDAGKVVASSAQRSEKDAAEAVPGMRGVPFFASLDAAPAAYRLRLAVVDARGRRGTVEHAVSAALTTGGGLAASDLLLSRPATRAGQRLQPVPDVDATSAVFGVVEVQGPAEQLAGATAVAEIASSETGPTLVAVPAQATTTPSGSRAFQATVATSRLPAGDYVLRMVVHTGGKPALSVLRGFRKAGAPVALRAVPSVEEGR